MNIVKKWGLPLLSILLTCLFPCAFMYFQNAGEASVVDFLPVLGLYLAVAAAAFVVLLVVLRNAGRAAVMTDLGMLVVMNFTMVCNGIKKLIPGFHNIIFLAICGVVLLALLVLMLKKKPDMTIVCGLASLAFGVMILMNGILAVPTIISTMTYETPVVAAAAESAVAESVEAVVVSEEVPEASQAEEVPAVTEDGAPEVTPEEKPGHKPEQKENPKDKPKDDPREGNKPGRQNVEGLEFQGEKRNVYFFLFDEYGGSENLMHYFGEDNEEFLGQLEARGFSVSRSSRNPESPWTVTLIPNIMNMDYVTSDEEEIKNRLTWLEDPTLYRLFRENGYQIDLINHEGFLGETGCRVISRGRRQENISDVIFDNGILSQIPGVEDKIRQDVLKQGSDEYKALMEVSDALRDCGNSPKNGPTLTVGYFVMPHAPFAADENGDPTAEETYYEWRENEPYLGMLRYTNTVILDAVDNIQKNDPEALILMMADHGARKPGHIYNQYGGPTFDADEEIPYMMNVLCCVYDPQNKVEVEGDTCINATRKTFDAAFGLELGTITPPPDYELSADDIIKDMGKGH